MADDDKKYQAFIRTLPCACCGGPGGEIHHPRDHTGLALRSSDVGGIPMCHQDHMDLGELKGAFRGFDKQRRKVWERTNSSYYRSLWEDGF